MYQLKLSARLCVCCGICMDVCSPRAIAMRVHTSRRVEGEVQTCRSLAGPGNPEPRPKAMQTFPYLADAARCDGCEACIRECPVEALTLVKAGCSQGASNPASL